MSEEETQQCSNCKKQIPASKIDLHENYCHRNVKKCSKCDEMIDKNEMEEHEAEMHKMMPCEHCNFQFEASKIKEHSNSCTEKPRNCEFCDLKVVGSDYAAHVKNCGSRTKKCELCQKNIPLRDFAFHEENCTDIVDQYPALNQPNFQSQAPQRRPEPPKPSVSYGSEWTSSNSRGNQPQPAPPAQVLSKPKFEPPAPSRVSAPLAQQQQPKPAQNNGPTNYFPPKTTIPMPTQVKKEEPKPVATKPITTTTATKFHSTNTKLTTPNTTKPGLSIAGDHVHTRDCTCGQNHKPPVPTVQRTVVPAKPAKPPVEEEKKQAPAPVKKAAPKPEPAFIPPEEDFDDEAMARKIQEEFDMQLAQEMHGEKPVRVSNAAVSRDEELARQIYSEMNKNQPAGIPSVNTQSSRQAPSNPGMGSQRPAQPTQPSRPAQATRPPQQAEPSRISQNTRPIVPREQDFHGVPGGAGWGGDYGGDFDDRPMTASGVDAELQRAIEESIRQQSKGPAIPAKPEPKKTTSSVTNSTTGSRRR